MGAAKSFFPSPSAVTAGGPSQLPADLDDFTGRQDELEKIVAALSAQGGSVAITALRGMGGVGKTTLAMHVGRLLKGQYPDGQVVVDMRGQSATPMETRATLTEVTHTFAPDAPEPTDESAAARLYRETLTGKRVLVVLDNAPGGAALRPATPPDGCGLIVTAREPVFLHDNALHLPLDMLPREQSVKLLRAAAGGRSDVTADEWDAIAHACGDLPLALRVAAAYLALNIDVSATDYLADLKAHRPETLKQGDDRERDVLAVLGLSVERLVEKKSRTGRALVRARGFSQHIRPNSRGGGVETRQPNGAPRSQ